MKHNSKLLLLYGALVLGLVAPRLADAAGFCDGSNNAGDACQTAGTTGLTGPASGNITATEITGLTTKNSGSASANNTNTQYWFYAYDHSLAAPNLSAGSASFDLNDTTGHRVRAGSGDPDRNPSPSPGDLIVGGSITNLLSNTAYDIYVEACFSSDYNDGSNNGTNCSDWIRMPYSPVTTKSLPVNPFLNPVKADVTTNSLNVNVNTTNNALASFVNPVDPQSEQAIISNLDIAVAPQTIGPNTFGQPFPIALGTPPSGYNWLPNTKYQYAGLLFYPYSQTTGNTPTAFYTTPVNPGTVANPFNPAPTHVTATVNFQNAAGAIGNHGTNNGYATGTTYTVSLAPASGSVATPAPVSVKSVTGSPTEPLSAFFTGLTDGATYTATVQAINEGGASWNNSAPVTIGTFVTQAFNLTLTITNISTGSAVANIQVGSPSGLTTYGIQFSPLAGVNGISWPGGNLATFPETSLNANTAYTVRATLCEGAFCSNPLPAAGVIFDTLPVAPTTPVGFGTVTANSIQANWTDSSTNGAGTTYDMQFCSNFTGTTCNVAWTDFGTHPPKSGSGAQTGTITGLSALTNYLVQVRTISISGNAANDSAFLLIGSTETLDTSVNMSAITFKVFTSSISLSVTASGGIGPYVYHWSVSPTAGTSFTSNDTTSTPNNTFMLYSTVTSYIVTVTATDNSGAGPGIGTQQVTINPGQTPTTITINPPTATLGQGGNAPFSATVTDQFGQVMVGESVTWTVGSCASLSGTNPAASITVTGVNVGSCQLTATDQSATGQATITVSGTAPKISNVTISPNPVTGTTGVLTVTASGFNNDPLSYSWSFVSGPSPVQSFVPNNSPSAVSSTVTFSGHGTYTINVTATDTINNQSTTAPITFIVNQTLDHLTVCPAGMTSCPNNITIQTFAAQQFTANGFDQFGDPMTITVTWSTNGGGNISGSGVFNSPTIGLRIIVTAKEVTTGKTGSATVSLVSFDVSGAYAYPVPFKASMGISGITFANLGTDAHLRIYTTSGRKVFETEITNCVDQTKCLVWPVQNSSGENLASGVYFFVIESSQGKKDGKLIIIK